MNSGNVYLKKAVPFLFLFMFVNTLAIVFGKTLDAKKIDHTVIIAANIILFIIALITLALHTKSVKSSNPNMFTNSVMGATMLKLIIAGGCVLAYVTIAGKNRSTMAVIISMVLYLVYTFMEVMIALQLNKKKNAGN
jgi:hypothetical protein